ncbi:MAG: FAD-dependent oxidoreductase [Planctomycetota bacterium]|jgi:NADPH-dependent glutamate synthase beta subunit-like oxidoreductase
MPKLTIDNREIEFPEGATILDAAEKLGIEIPTLCFLKTCEPSTSCMVCVVKVEGAPSLVPACATIATDGMQVESDSPQVLDARKAALELLLSDHLGDCMGPCHMTCPARMDIPLMIRQIAAGNLISAILTVKKDIALPAALGRICPAPCEKQCRRAAHDKAVSICLLKRYVADVDLQSENPYLPQCQPSRGKKVAIIGAGPAGLAAAYYLRREGFECTIFDDHDQPGGMLRYAIEEDQLPREVLDREIDTILAPDIDFRCQSRIGDTITIKDLQKDFDAVFVAVGRLEEGQAEAMGFEASKNGVAIDGSTYQTSIPGIFAGGDAVRNRKVAVRSVADGKEAAASITQYLLAQPLTGPTKPFNTRIGKLKEGEMEIFLKTVSAEPRIEPTAADGGFTDDQARAEAARCLHCDCRKPNSCKLRRFAAQYEAKSTRYKGERRLFEQVLEHPEVIYEPGKCIDCGICIQIAARHNEELGLAFTNRGFDVRVAVPFNRSLAEGLKKAAPECIKSCPTGALASKD